MIVLLLAASAGAIWYFVFNKPAVTNNSETTQNSVVAETDPNLIKMITPTTGEVWLDKPVAIEKQGYMIDEEYSQESYSDYYKVGNRDGNDIIAINVPGPGGSSLYLFEKSPSGEVSSIAHPSASALYDENYNKYIASIFNDSVLINTIINYDIFNIPNSMKLDDKGSVVLAPIYPSLGSFTADNLPSNITRKLVKQLGKNALMKSESLNLTTGLTSIYYYLKTAINTEIALRYEPLDVSLTNYQWNSGQYIDNRDSLKAMTYGCGSLGKSIVTADTNIKDSDVKIVGRSGLNLTVYGFSDSSNPLLLKAYDEYKQAVENQMGIEYNGPEIKSIDDFVNQHAVVLFKDLSGQWLVYSRKQMSTVGQCAKPVVYLYPTTAQTVWVKVGADVKVSEPQYNPSTGWIAFAQPNGQLTVNGAKYGSLFWEGPGYGQYPEISGGKVVKQADVISTIRQQLAQQGLNTTEINEFVSYWQDQVPNKPYVRLTWFNTSQMNQLAPLYISPKPDTLIRVFLDMSGMDSPISIPAQNLTSVPRNGFTVVEWGGLSSKKLY